MTRWILRSAILTLGGVGLALAADAPKPSRPPADPAIATVGTIRISRLEYQTRVEQALAEYRRRTGTAVPAEIEPVVRRQLLERMIERNLLILESRRLGTTATDAEAEAVIRQDPFFQEGGKFNAAKFEAVRNSNPAMFRSVVEQAREKLVARRLSERIEAQSRPDEEALRIRAARGLGRTALEFLALRRREIAGTYPEPRESEVLDWYRSHLADFRRPDRAVVSILPVNQGISDSLAGAPGGIAVWERSLRERADSVLRVLQAGGRLEDIARGFTGYRPGVVIDPGRLPSYWRGDASLVSALFDLKPGSILPELVPSNPGWLVVRVDEAERAHTGRLAEVAREIRSRLREDQRQNHETRALEAIYSALRDSLRGPAWRVRFAVIDTAMLNPGVPTPQDLDRYYRGHLADYSSFDNATGTITATPFADVRDEIRRRWIHDRSLELTRALAGKLLESWSRGRRDAALERSATAVRDVGPVPLGVPVDSGLAGQVIGDTLERRAGALGTGLGRYPRGTLVFHVYQRVPDHVPGFAQARRRLESRLATARARDDEVGARALFDRAPMQFAGGNVLHWSQVRFEAPNFMTMDMTRDEVEEYMRQHLDRYSAPELVHVSHILISPLDGTPEADRTARDRADSLLNRIRGGEDLAKLARQHSDDEATRDEGGDLGQFGRGAMLEEFERAAFAMRAGDVSGPVKTSAGYHILKCHEYLPAAVQPLVRMYGNVCYDLARDKADSVAARRADSLYRAVHTPAQAMAAVRRLGLEWIAQSRTVGEIIPPEVHDVITWMEKLKPGEFYPGTWQEKGLGWCISWVDSITAPGRPTWERARGAALERYRREAGQRALEAKRAELDSMIAAGWTVDSLATLWGGLERLPNVAAGASLPGLGTRDLDSLLFGRGTRPPALAVGEMSDWITFPFGVARIRVSEREAPDPEQVAARLENERRAERERKLRGYYENLKRRYAVRILDARLRAVMLPTLPGADAP